ncbi:MAG TPA: DUF3175 domain-containing protein [Verrucomicrobiae bacterium]|nr:DUF3175 domain-containing protein [Verrucomicrobiae bacterium]
MNAKKHGPKWSAGVTLRSNALDLDRGVFKLTDPHKIALSLKRSATRSHRRKANPYRSAMSMLNFYINRAGAGLAQRQKHILANAREELRSVFHRPAKSHS